MQEDYGWILEKYRELTEEMSQPELAEDPSRREKLMKDFSAFEPIARAAEELFQARKQLAEARELAQDPELGEMAREEMEQLQESTVQQEHALQLMLLPRDPDGERNVVMEIRAGAGGEEAALFGALLLRMYTRYAERHGLTLEMVDLSPTELGGVKEAEFLLKGKGAFEKLQFESGVHRIQRVPTTESGGRIHTSTCTVAVLPEAEDVEVVINPNDLRIDLYRAGGAGGQHVNRTDSAVRMTHLPTGIVAQCQNERSQIQNREVCLRILKSRIYDRMREEKDQAYAARRRGQVGTGDRSERIRTYNFPQGRVTDHRIGLTLYRIEEIVDGDLDEIITALTLQAQESLLKGMNGVEG